MYAHQVIEDTKKYCEWIKKKPSFNQDWNRYIINLHANLKMIKAAQKFNLSNIDGLFSMGKSYFNNYQGYSIFKGDSADVRLPYKTCWFDYQVPEDRLAPRRGILALEVKPDTIVAFPASYTKKPNLFLPGIQAYSILLNGGIKFFDTSPPGSTFDPNEAFLDDQKDLVVLNLALLLLSCKNISTVKNNPPEALNRKRQKRGKQELFEYHTLVVVPFGKKQASEPKHLWDNRIHLCRGHFKTYKKENPLFGKFVGRFFWNPQVRGKNKKGVVMKDYALKEKQ